MQSTFSECIRRAVHFQLLAVQRAISIIAFLDDKRTNKATQTTQAEKAVNYFICADVMMDCFCGAFRWKKNAFPSKRLLSRQRFFFCFIQQGKKKKTNTSSDATFFSHHNRIRFRPISCSVAMYPKRLTIYGEWGECDPKQHPASTRIYFNVQPC